MRLLADEIGPRRPTSDAERRAAERLRDELGERGLDATLEPFDGYSTFAAPFGVISALAIAPALLPPRRRLARSVLALTAAAGLVTEGGLTRTPLSRALSTRPSQNLVATIEPAGDAVRTVCLSCHLDTSRSGFLFDPRFVPHLNNWLTAQSIAGLAQAGEPLIGGTRWGRRVLGAARLVLGAGLVLLAEREMSGKDVPGGNDNASGVAVVAELALELAASPPGSTRVVVLMTGCEEAGMLGSQAFLDAHDTSGWIFVNVDNVGAERLHYLPSEGLIQKWGADPALMAIASRVAREQPELRLREATDPIGLTYDATPVLARGGRALTLVAAGEGGAIPNYHWPTDTAANVEAEALERALVTAREMVAAIDRGEAD